MKRLTFFRTRGMVALGVAVDRWDFVFHLGPIAVAIRWRSPRPHPVRLEDLS